MVSHGYKWLGNKNDTDGLMKATHAKKLTEADIPEIHRVFDTRSTLMKIPLTDQKREQHKLEIEQCIKSKDNLLVCWGAFDEQNKLCSYLVQEFSLLYPRWYIKVLVTEESQNLRPLNMRHSGLGLCIDRAITAAERVNYFEWMYAVVPDRFGTRAKIWTRQSESVSRYIFVIDDAFKPEEEPRFTYQKSLIPEAVQRNKTWIIKKAVLKPEHRFEVLNKNNRLDLTYEDAYNV